MKKIWFNKEDFIVVEHTGGEFYDVIQKIQAPDQLETAAKSIGIKLNKDDYNIYRLDEDENNEDDETIINPNENHVIDKHVYRQREKERDNSRRKNRDEDKFDRPILIANQSSDSDSNSESDSESDSDNNYDDFGNKLSKK